MLWTHLPNRDDMFAVFDQVKMKDHDGIVRDKRLLKLVRGADNIVCISSMKDGRTLFAAHDLPGNH